MRPKRQNHHSALQVALLAGGAVLTVSLLAGGASAPETARVELETAAKSAAGGPRGPVGPEGPRGPRGKRGKKGARGPVGAVGPAGADAPAAVREQQIAIAWQNGSYAGRDRQGFVAPGIGVGSVRCTPPNPNEPNGVMWVRFVPDDNGGPTTPPANWATTMWTLRSGGNVDDANRSKTTVVRTSRVDSPNEHNGFHESMNTAVFGHDPISIGSFTGMITTEPFETTSAPPAPTSFQLSWHWDFTTLEAARCYIAGSFITEAS